MSQLDCASRLRSATVQMGSETTISSDREGTFRTADGHWKRPVTTIIAAQSD
jgi:hypothetical protein